MSQRVLIVEDDLRIADIIAKNLGPSDTNATGPRMAAGRWRSWSGSPRR